MTPAEIDKLFADVEATSRLPPLARHLELQETADKALALDDLLKVLSPIERVALRFAPGELSQKEWRSLAARFRLTLRCKELHAAYTKTPIATRRRLAKIFGDGDGQVK